MANYLSFYWYIYDDVLTKLDVSRLLPWWKQTGDVLCSFNSWSLSNLTGIPLPLLGLVAYGLVLTLSLQENGKNFLPGIDDLDIRLTLLLISTSMATASSYFLYILNTRFIGTSCSYCLLSAFLSFTLFSIRVKVSA